VQTEFVLNLLIFAEFGKWKSKKDIIAFIEYIEEIIQQELPEMNRITLSYNPILTICLACQHLTAIGDAISFFKHQANTIIDDLLQLGQNIISNIEVDDDGEDIVKILFMDVDFMDRTVLHLITHNEYVPLLTDEKISVLLDQLWQGADTYYCDGKVTDYSKLTMMATTPLKNLEGKTITMGEVF